MTDKQALRRAMRRMRGRLTPEALADAAQLVVPRVLGLPSIRSGPVLLYVSIRRELPTESLFRALWSAGIETAVPAMTADGMEARMRRPDSPLVPDTAGIPTVDGPAVSADIVLCPGLAFDRRGGRLGYGGGNYDRWLDKHDANAVGLCVDDALIDDVPLDAHDARMTAIVTPSGVWAVS